MIDKYTNQRRADNLTYHCPIKLDLTAVRTDYASANILFLFVETETSLLENLHKVTEAIKKNKLTWVAYPKAKQLNTDINRGSIRLIVNQNGLNRVRQISLDET